jgi:hypothetical protein
MMIGLRPRRVSVLMFSVVSTVIALAPTLGANAAPTCFGSREVVSPDGQLFAKVRRIGRTGCGESSVKILDRAGRTLSEPNFVVAIRELTTSDGPSLISSNSLSRITYAGMECF